MSVVTIQLGQCGNQIGSQLFSTLYEDACHTIRPGNPTPYHDAAIERFFVTKEVGRKPILEARAVLVDMESKVVQHSVTEARRCKQWEYDPTCVFTQKRGAGNNWANGYCKCGPISAEKVLDMVQRQAERCDRLDSFLILMSVAGGTGSGVGAYITKTLREDFPHVTIVNQIVWPYSSGEVIVQDYNTILTTAHLQKASDAIILMQNDQLHKACSKLLLLKQISFSDINRVICHALASIIQPSSKLEHFKQNQKTDDPFLYQQCSISDLQSQLCPHPDYKFLSVKNVPQMPERSHAYSRYLWSGLLKNLRQMLITDAPIEEGVNWTMQLESGDDPTSSLFSYRRDEPQKVAHVHHGVNKSLANLLILRGNELDTADVSPFCDPRLYCGWIPESFTSGVWCSRHAFNKYEKCCTLLSNSQSCISPLDSVCQKAWNMFTAKAYVHQYLQYGLTEEEFLGSFITVEQILKDYATIGC